MSASLPVFLQDAAERSRSIKRKWIIAGTCAVGLLLILVSLPRERIVTLWKEHTAEPSLFEAAGNSTLGFSAIYALTLNTTWRVQGIEAAANLTGLDVDFYHPRQVPEDEMQAFRKPKDGGSGIGRGKALAWLSHMDVIKHIVDQELETALIIEDDVDWDVYVREQLVQVSEAFGKRQAVLEGKKGPGAVAGNPNYPYGLDWDLLWLGHNWIDLQGIGDMYVWRDSTVPDKWKGNVFVPYFDVFPHGHRALIEGLAPVSTFAYALTLDGAKKLLKGGAVVDEVSEAWDVRVSRLCGNKHKLDCLTVATELFHHHIPPSKDGFEASDSVSADHGKDRDTIDAVSLGMGTTDNIVNSARCQALFNKTCAD